MANHLQVRQSGTVLAAAGTTGNVTGSAVSYRPNGDSGYSPVGFQFVVEAVGGTPTVTFKYQGSLDGVTWTDVLYTTPANAAASQSTQTVTGTGTTINFLAVPTTIMWSYFRVVTTANTNVTFRAELYYPHI